MGMEHTQGVLLRCDVVAQHQVQLVLAVSLAGDGGDGVVGITVGLGKDKGVGVRVSPPGGKNLVRQVHQALIVGAAQPDDGEGPVDDARLHVLKAREGDGLFHWSLLHGKGVAAALEVVMAQDGAAHDGQVRVGAHEVVGELADEVQLLAEGGAVDLHGDVLAVEDDAVLVIVDIGAVLEEPALPIDGDGDDPVILAGGMVHPAGVALILPAQLALGIAALGRRLGGGDGPGVLLRFGEVDGDVQVPKLRGGDPFHIPGDAVAADVVRILAEPVVPVGGGLRGLGIALPEGSKHLGGAGRQAAHQLRVQQVPADHAALDAAVGFRPVQDVPENILQGAGGLGQRLRLGESRQVQRLQQPVHRPGVVGLLDEARADAVIRQLGKKGIDHGLFLLTRSGCRPRGGWRARGSCLRPALPRSAS